MVVLTLAVLPTVGMLEAGLRAADASGELDAARALANEKLEEAQALPYDKPGGAADSVVERYAPPGPARVRGTTGVGSAAEASGSEGEGFDPGALRRFLGAGDTPGARAGVASPAS